MDLISYKSYVFNYNSFSPITGKFVIDIPIGNITDEKMEEIEGKFRNLKAKGKKILMREIEKIRVDKKLLEKLRAM